MTQDRTDQLFNELEELFAEESSCEMKHNKTTCTSSVAAVAVDCRRQFLVCHTAARIIEKMIEQQAACIHCGRPAKDCWKVVTA